MKTIPKKANHSTRNTIIIVASVIVVAGILGSLWFLGGQRNSQTTTPNSTPPASPTDTNKGSPASAPASSTPGNTVSNPKSNTGGGSAAGATNTVAVSITSVDQTQPNTLIVSAYASTVVASGTCTFTFTQNDKTFTRTTQTLQNSTTSPCDTLSVRNAEFPALGAWLLVVSFLSGSTTGASSQQTVVLK